MRTMRKILLTGGICLFLLASGRTQDIHFTQFTMSPLMMNPANTGAFHGTYRVGGIYRDQWMHLSHSFQTPAIYIDAPIIRGFRAYDWIGVGVNFFQDQAGAAGLQFSGLLMSGAYHLALNKTSRDVITFGFGGGRMNRRVNLNSDRIKLEDEILAGTGAPQSIDRTSGQNKTDYVDLNAGIGYTRKLANGKFLRAGLSLNHFNKPQYRLRGGNGDADRLPWRWTANAEVELKVNDKWSVTPALLFQRMTNVNEIQAQALAGYLFNAEKEITLLGGLGYRLGDAIPILAGVQWKALRVGVSWDYNHTEVTPAGNGGFEIAASYIGRIYKKPSVKPVIVCPRF